MNRAVARALAGPLSERFVEVLYAPGFAPQVLETLGAKNNAPPRDRRGAGA